MRIALGVEYDGALFCGWQTQCERCGVQDHLETALAAVAQQEIKTVAAGRTDAGVHGWGQVVSGDLPEGTDLAGMQRRINKLCGPTIAVHGMTLPRPVRWEDDLLAVEIKMTVRDAVRRRCRQP